MRSENELTVPAAAERVGLDKRTFRELVPGVFRPVRQVREGRGVGYRFDSAQLDDDRAKAPRCSFPSCDELAGTSGRCGQHAARVKHETVELICQAPGCGRRFTRPGSWLRERDGRGTFCSNRCKGLAAYEKRRDDLHAPFTAEESSARQARIADAIKSAGLLDRYYASVSALNLYRYSGSHLVAHGPLEVRLIEGSPRAVIAPADLVSWKPPWADQLERRVNIAYGRTRNEGVFGRLGGKDRDWSVDQALEVLRRDAEGQSQERIAYLTGLTRRQVRYILGR